MRNKIMGRLEHGPVTQENPFVLVRSEGLIIPGELSGSFGALPQDRFLKSRYTFRHRRFDTLVASRSKLRWLPHTNYSQSLKENPYAGGIVRVFEPLDDLLKKFSAEKMIPAILKYLPDAEYEVGVHPIRITADHDNAGHPAPEGPHRDGNDYTVLLCVDKLHVEGAETTLSTVAPPHKPVVVATLAPGDLLIIDDRALMHNTTAFMPAPPYNDAYRDVFSLGFNAISEGD